MALSKAKVREILSKAGVDTEHMQDAVTEILDGNIASIDAVKEERDRYKADAEKLPSVQKELDELKATMSEDGNRSPYKKKFEDLQKEYNDLKDEYDTYKANVDAEKVTAQKSDAYRKLLKEAGVSDKRLDSVLKVTDVSKLEFDDEGNLKNKDELVKGIKEEWSDFIATESKQGAKVTNPPTNASGNPIKKTKEEIFAIKDTAERQKAMLENKELFIN